MRELRTRFFRPVCKHTIWQPAVTHDRKIVRWHTKPYMNSNNNIGCLFFGGYKYIALDANNIKPASQWPILKSLMALVLTNVIGCDSCLLRSHPIFRSHCPTDRIRFLLYLSHNAFRTMIEMNNRMRSIRSSLTCQSPSDFIRFFKNRIRLCAPTARFSLRSVKPSNNLAMGRRL